MMRWRVAGFTGYLALVKALDTVGTEKPDAFAISSNVTDIQILSNSLKKENVFYDIRSLTANVFCVKNIILRRGLDTLYDEVYSKYVNVDRSQRYTTFVYFS